MLPDDHDVVFWSQQVTPSKGKIHRVDMHPVKPWVLAGDMSESIAIYDYKSGERIRVLNFNTLLDHAREEEATRAVLESQPDYIGPRRAAAALRWENPGKLKDVRMYDKDVVFWKLCEQSEEGMMPADITHLGLATVFQTLLFIMAEHKIAIVDVDTLEYVEIHQKMVGNVSFSSMDFVYGHPWLLIGGTDGQIRVFDFKVFRHLETMRLDRGHSKEVTRVITVQKPEGMDTSGLPFVVSCGADGRISSWDMQRNQQPLDVVDKAHRGKGIVDMQFIPSSGILVTAGTDKHLVTRLVGPDGRVGQEPIARSSKKFRRPLQSVGVCSVCRSTKDWVFGLDKESTMWGMSSEARPKESVWFDAASLPGAPKNFKLYSCRRHPLQPNLITLGSNRGIIVLRLDSSRTPSFQSCFGTDHTAENPSRQVFYFGKDGLYRSELHMEKVRASAHRKVVESHSLVLGRPPRGSVLLRMSPSQRYLALVWEDVHEYEIIRLSDCKVIHEGTNCNALEWCSYEDRLAILAHNRELTASHILVAVINQGSFEVQPNYITPEAPTPVRKIFGGPMLGVAFVCHDAALAAKPHFFRFYAWDSGDPCGDFMSKPGDVYWDRSQELVVMTFGDSEFCVFKTRPTFQLVCRVPSVAKSGFWYNRTFFYATDEDIKCLFPHPTRMEAVTLSSFNVSTSSRRSADLRQGPASTSISSNDSMSISNRPTGLVSIFDVIDGYLCIGDTHNRLFFNPLDDVVLKFQILVTAQQIDAAMEWVPLIHVKQYLRLADFLESRGFPERAVNLPEVPNSRKIEICLEHSLWDSIFDVLQAAEEELEQWQKTPEIEAHKLLLAKTYAQVGMLADAEDNVAAAKEAFSIAGRFASSAYRLLIVFLVRHNLMEELSRWAVEFGNMGLYKEAALAYSLLGSTRRQGSVSLTYNHAHCAILCSSRKEDISGLVSMWESYLAGVYPSNKKVTLSRSILLPAHLQDHSLDVGGVTTSSASSSSSPTSGKVSFASAVDTLSTASADLSTSVTVSASIPHLPTVPERKLPRDRTSIRTRSSTSTLIHSSVGSIGGSAPSSNPTGSHSSLGSSRSPSQTLRGDGTQTDVSLADTMSVASLVGTEGAVSTSSRRRFNTLSVPQTAADRKRSASFRGREGARHLKASTLSGPLNQVLASSSESDLAGNSVDSLAVPVPIYNASKSGAVGSGTRGEEEDEDAGQRTESDVEDDEDFDDEQ